jgi:cyclin C
MLQYTQNLFEYDMIRKQAKLILIRLLSVIQSLGEQLKLRQQVIATATIYFKRFYSRYYL